MTIDNGNHLLLSGNRAALDYLREVGAADRLIGPAAAEFQFIDLASRQRWTLRFNDGRVPWWIFDPARRVPGTRALDYLALARLLWPPAGKTVGEIIACQRAALLAAGRAAPARRAQYRSAARLGEARRRGDPRDARGRRPRLPAAPRARRLERDADRAGARLAAAARRARAARASASRAPLRRAARRRARFRRRDDRARRRRRRHPRGAALCRRVADPRAKSAERVPRHRQCAFPRRTAAGSAADPRRAQRHGRMDFRLSRPVVGHDQRRRSFDRYARGRSSPRRSGRRWRA